MRLQVKLLLLLLAFMLTKVKSVQVNSPEKKFCAQCEEEIWEEIPCKHIKSTTLAPPITTTIKKTLIPSTSLPPVTSSSDKKTTTTLLPPTSTPKTPTHITKQLPSRPKPTLAPMRSTPFSIESNDSYKQCYCECKSGCKEFCRKVHVYPDNRKQITQISKTTQPMQEGKLEVKHLFERNWIPAPIVLNPKGLPKPSQTYDQQQQSIDNKQPKPQIQQNQNAENAEENASKYGTQQKGANYQRQHDVDSFGFSINELTKLFNTNQNYANIVPEISQTARVLQNLHTSPFHAAIQPKNSYLYTPPQKIASLDAKTFNTGIGSAQAIATSKIDFKESAANSYSGKHEDLESQIGIKPIIHSQLAPRAPQYKHNFPLSNNLPKEDPILDNYIRNLMYPSPPKGPNYGYSLSF